MKSLLICAVFTALTAQTASAMDAHENLTLDHCEPTAADFETCSISQLDACLEAEPVGLLGRACQNVFGSEADETLNQFYKEAVHAAKNVEKQFRGTAWQGQEELLRKSQRAWVKMRDTTCLLSGQFGAVNSGADADIAECAGRLSIRRVADLQKEIGQYMQ